MVFQKGKKFIYKLELDDESTFFLLRIKIIILDVGIDFVNAFHDQVLFKGSQEGYN